MDGPHADRVHGWSCSWREADVPVRIWWSFQCMHLSWWPCASQRWHWTWQCSSVLHILFGPAWFSHWFSCSLHSAGGVSMALPRSVAVIGWSWPTAMWSTFPIWLAGLNCTTCRYSHLFSVLLTMESLSMLTTVTCVCSSSVQHNSWSRAQGALLIFHSLPWCRVQPHTIQTP